MPIVQTYTYAFQCLFCRKCSPTIAMDYNRYNIGNAPIHQAEDAANRPYTISCVKKLANKALKSGWFHYDREPEISNEINPDTLYYHAHYDDNNGWMCGKCANRMKKIFTKPSKKTSKKKNNPILEGLKKEEVGAK